jgi:SPP1 family predicted phage head-tail adaptor
VRQLGRLNRRIELLEQRPNYDDLGRQTRGPADWIVKARVWAEVRDLTGNELERAKQMVVTGTTAVAIRFTPAVNPRMRVRFRHRILEIRAVLDSSSDQRELILVCGEVK